MRRALSIVVTMVVMRVVVFVGMLLLIFMVVALDTGFAFAAAADGAHSLLLKFSSFKFPVLWFE
jgi:hypothetical protein